jgi:hypothetical protein
MNRYNILYESLKIMSEYFNQYPGMEKVIQFFTCDFLLSFSL